MNFKNHPCFSENARHTTGRIHLPVAPKCNIQCNFCDRKYDCINESRPGVTSGVLNPRQAADYLEKIIEKVPAIAVAGIAGPGDPLANPEETLETFRLVRKSFSDLHLCMATNGLELEKYADDIAAVGVNHLTVTVNAVDPVIGSRIYSWVRHNKRPRRGVEGAEVLLEMQRRGIEKIKKHGIILKINSVVIAGVNDYHIADISREMSALGADLHNCIPLYSVEGTPFSDIPSVTAQEMKMIRDASSMHLKQMTHCARCRADAVGMLGEANSDEIVKMLDEASRKEFDPDRPCIAVASMEGIFVNQHLGEARELWIFSGVSGKPEFLEKRSTPLPGGGDERWEELAEILHDCSAVLVSGSGEAPLRVLKSKNIDVITMEGFAMEGMEALTSGAGIPAVMLKTPGKCGAGLSCSGTGTGCG